ncbi:hypothetical protein FNJ88_03120 [Chryseobacterium sp. SNU WT5]|uniref:hypothetical protein n=1 Tax=Chryseobacterium sp. SNU WT5 TaxID=2594269 RepID=UPI00117F0254|nr:hypothetical protein [Chryseobacterium sp. SNU WT5]QDP84585.1 hypothetical protein FNJ88_03120 [Chryseobacterium sp. SNU WT5]
MSEGPSILFLKNKLQRYKGKTVSKVSGKAEVDGSLFTNSVLIDIQTYGKNFLFVFKDFFVAIEVRLVGNVLVNKRKKIAASFSFHFEENEINFYDSEISVKKGKPSDCFNFKIDISKAEFDADFILNEWQTNHFEESIGEALLNQNILAGVGPIIRTETLYHAKIHPDSLIKSIPEKKLIFLLKMVQDYAEEFLTLLKTDSVEKNALIFEKKNCPKDKTPIIIETVGSTKTYVCPKCQKLFK